MVGVKPLEAAVWDRVVEILVKHAPTGPEVLVGWVTATDPRGRMKMPILKPIVTTTRTIWEPARALFGRRMGDDRNGPEMGIGQGAEVRGHFVAPGMQKMEPVESLPVKKRVLYLKQLRVKMKLWTQKCYPHKINPRLMKLWIKG